MFDTILRELLDSVPGARGVVFCDPEGETVTAVGASGRIDREQNNDFDLRVTGAQFATPIYLARIRTDSTFGTLQECIISGAREVLLVHLLPLRYYVVVCLGPGALASRGMRIVRSFSDRIAREM